VTRRKIIGAAFFFALFGAMALMPPLVLLFRSSARPFGVPLETVYVFVLWIVLVAGAFWLSRSLPEDDPPKPDSADRP